MMVADKAAQLVDNRQVELLQMVADGFPQRAVGFVGDFGIVPGGVDGGQNCEQCLVRIELTAACGSCGGGRGAASLNFGWTLGLAPGACGAASGCGMAGMAAIKQSAIR